MLMLSLSFDIAKLVNISLLTKYIANYFLKKSLPAVSHKTKVPDDLQSRPEPLFYAAKRSIFGGGGGAQSAHDLLLPVGERPVKAIPCCGFLCCGFL